MRRLIAAVFFLAAGPLQAQELRAVSQMPFSFSIEKVEERQGKAVVTIKATAGADDVKSARLVCKVSNAAGYSMRAEAAITGLPRNSSRVLRAVADIDMDQWKNPNSAECRVSAYDMGILTW